MPKDPKFKIFMLAVPLVVLFSVGILMRSTRPVSAYPGCVADNLSGSLVADASAVFEGKTIGIPSLAYAETPNTQVLGQASPSERWIEVDLSEQKLRAWDGVNLFLETPISSGLPGTPTPIGEFHVWVKLRASKMEGGTGRGYYNLPNVPYVMYFENEDIPGWRGFGIHGAYWHNEFGTPRSHGCVNVPIPTAEKLYYWATPELPSDKTSIFASAENPGIKIIVHE